jgi:hypothetical protein
VRAETRATELLVEHEFTVHCSIDMAPDLVIGLTIGYALPISAGADELKSHIANY